MKQGMHMIQLFRDFLKIILRVIVGHDYRALNQYIIQINSCRDVEDILHGVSHCLKEILDYELFGFALKTNDGVDVWVDPKIHKNLLVRVVKYDFGSQNIDLSVHFLNDKRAEKSQRNDTTLVHTVRSYTVLETASGYARLYILPRRAPMRHQEEIISVVTRSMGIAVENALQIRTLENAASVDPLTNCYNRRALGRLLDNTIACANRYGHSLAVIMMDIDHFKQINDTYGHVAGDRILSSVAKLISSSVREADTLARFGGEEFTLILPETSVHSAALLADKLRLLLAGSSFQVGEKSVNVTASFGVASFRSGMDSTALISAADAMLYAAKAKGRNSVSSPAHERLNTAISVKSPTSPVFSATM